MKYKQGQLFRNNYPNMYQGHTGTLLTTNKDNNGETTLVVISDGRRRTWKAANCHLIEATQETEFPIFPEIPSYSEFWKVNQIQVKPKKKRGRPCKF